MKPSPLDSIDPIFAPRLRIFAGPNGSGKSTVIDKVREYKVDGHFLEFGVYVNADEIASQFRRYGIHLKGYGLSGLQAASFIQLATKSGLLSGEIGASDLESLIEFRGDYLILREIGHVEQVAQITAECIRALLVEKGCRFSFETVFSHPGKVEFMQRCAALGYKVYFYFVGTSSPEINKFRVASRVKNGGHDVPSQKIVDRYYRSMDLMWEAAQHCYQAFFFDNSRNDQESNLFAHFKVVDGRKVWENAEIDLIPEWFMKYYVKKAQQHEGL